MNYFFEKYFSKNNLFGNQFKQMKYRSITAEPILELTPTEHKEPNFQINLQTLKFIDKKKNKLVLQISHLAKF